MALASSSGVVPLKQFFIRSSPAHEYSYRYAEKYNTGTGEVGGQVDRAPDSRPLPLTRSFYRRSLWSMPSRMVAGLAVVF